MINRIYLPVLLIAFALTLGLVIASLTGERNVQASAPSGLPAFVATSSNPTVGTSPVVLFATSSACAARIITTYANPIMLTFSDNQGKIPTATYGHLQAASTTVAYDSGLYGCDLVRVYGYTANTAITVSESR